MNAEVYLSEEAAKERQRLDPTQDEKLLWHAARLARDVTLGEQLPRKQIPTVLHRRYACTNLWRMELPGAWRILYSIQSRPDQELTISILRILSHKEYDRLLGYHTS